MGSLGSGGGGPSDEISRYQSVTWSHRGGKHREERERESVRDGIGEVEQRSRTRQQRPVWTLDNNLDNKGQIRLLKLGSNYVHGLIPFHLPSINYLISGVILLFGSFSHIDNLITLHFTHKFTT